MAGCSNCIQNNDGSATCCGVDDPKCRMGEHLPANDYEAEATIEIERVPHTPGV